MIEYSGMHIKTCKNVYNPAEDSFMLSNNLLIKKGDFVLEIGTGTGIIGLNASKTALKVVATDINPYAIKCAIANKKLNDVKNLEIRNGNLFNPVLNEKFDLVLFNTPYLPSEKDEGVDDHLDDAWNGGINGREVIDPFLDNVKNHLNNKGTVQLVQSSLSDIEKSCQKLKKMGFNVQITARERFFFEEVVVISGFLNKSID
ncbi:MAG: class I SAM-dependent methyltransferase [Methanobacteriaceae archaeon]|nr:class I SAM-dependent methyltransferase [Methanobacteriaceae archaeon]